MAHLLSNCLLVDDGVKMLPKDGYPFSNAFKAELNIIEKVSRKVGVVGKKGMKQCSYLSGRLPTVETTQMVAMDIGDLDFGVLGEGRLQPRSNFRLLDGGHVVGVLESNLESSTHVPTTENFSIENLDKNGSPFLTESKLINVTTKEDFLDKDKLLVQTEASGVGLISTDWADMDHDD